MKKKAIESLSFQGIEEPWGKDIIYQASAEIKTIGNEEMLLVAIYTNPQEGDEGTEPSMVVCVGKTDFANYYPKLKTWDGKRLENLRYEELPSSNDKNTRINQGLEETIKQYSGGTTYWGSNWKSNIERLQDLVNFDRNRKKHKRKAEALKERMEHTEEIPEDFIKFTESRFGADKIIFYKRTGRYVTCNCGHCGNSYTFVTTTSPDITGVAERYGRAPRVGDAAACHCCRKIGTYKQVGRGSEVEKTKYFYLLQKYKECGVVVRHFEIIQKQSIHGPNTYKIWEVERSYFEKGKRVQKDYQFYGKWHYSNMQSMNPIRTTEGILYRENLKEALKGTILEYSALEAYMTLANITKIRVEKYMETYIKHPFLEQMVKMGLKGIAGRMIEGFDSFLNLEGKNAMQVLKIAKPKLNRLIEREGQMDMLRLLQMEEALGLDLKDEIEEKLLILSKGMVDCLRYPLEIMSPLKYIHAMEKYIGQEIKESYCSNAANYMYEMARLYDDYLSMRRGEGYDMNDTIVRYPKNLKEEHDEMVKKRNLIATEKMARKKNLAYANIKENYQKNAKKYTYQDEKYFIRPAEDAAEIMQEGRMLHHCVGDDRYLERHNEGKRFILLLRKVEEPDIPYYTIEIKDSSILQSHGAYNKKPEWEQVKRWLNSYTKHLQNGTLQRQRKEKAAALKSLRESLGEEAIRGWKREREQVLEYAT